MTENKWRGEREREIERDIDNRNNFGGKKAIQIEYRLKRNIMNRRSDYRDKTSQLGLVCPLCIIKTISY